MAKFYAEPAGTSLARRAEAGLKCLSGHSRQAEQQGMGQKRETREQIGILLETTGWLVCDVEATNFLATHGVFIREFY